MIKGSPFINHIVLFVALFALALVSLHPFLVDFAGDTLPLTDDGNLHIYRAIVLDDAMRADNTLYPRYTTGLAYGYGAPLFNYFPPTSYYPIVGFHALGLSWIAAWKATIILYVVLAAWGAYLWARQWISPLGSIVAAAAYIYAPYTLFDTVTRGSSNEFAGMALLPFALWGFTRLAHYGRRRDFLLAIGSYALFIMMHNVMTLYGSLLLVAYCGFLLLAAPTQERRRVGVSLFAAGLLAVAMTAFFWLPALAETDAVKIDGVLNTLSFIDVTETLRDLPAVFALPTTADSTQLQPITPIAFHAVVLLVGIAGFFLPQPNRTHADKPTSIAGLHALLFATLALVTLSQLEWSAEGWQSLPLLRYSQFAWRPMSIGALVLALLGGIGTAYALHSLSTRAQYILLTGLLTLIILYSVPWLYRPQITLVADTLTDAQAYEVSAAQPALSSYGEYLPAQTNADALTIPRPARPRLQPNLDVRLQQVSETGTIWQATLTSEQATTLILEWLYVPGWQASIDGERVTVTSIGEAGFVSVDIPAGEYNVRVWYGGTPLQTTSVLISSGAVLIALASLFFMRRQHTASLSMPDSASWSLLGMVMLVGVVLFVFKISVIDRIDSPLRTDRLQDGVLQGVEMSISEDASNFGNRVRLLGTSAIPDSGDSLAAGDTLTFDLYWTLPDAPLERDYRSLVQLVNAQGIVIAESSNFTLGGLATQHWLSGYYVTERITLPIPLYTPPADYRLVVSVYDSETTRPLDVLNSANNPTGITSALSIITLIRPDAPPEMPSVRIFSNDSLSLISVDGVPAGAQVGDELLLDFVWGLHAPLTTDSADVDAALVWESAETTTRAERTLSALVPAYPITEWQVGDVWRGVQRLYVPSDLAAGSYALSMRIGDTSYALDQTLQVTVPPRDFTLPSPDTRSDARWQNDIVLLGFDRVGNQLTLYWQPRAIIPDNLRLFVQVLDANGQVITVRDSIPQDAAQGPRPTSSWVSDEIITTQHDLGTLQDTNATLLIGWYDPLTGERISLADDTADALRIGITP